MHVCMYVCMLDVFKGTLMLFNTDNCIMWLINLIFQQCMYVCMYSMYVCMYVCMYSKAL
jgi:hypothetical protein